MRVLYINPLALGGNPAIDAIACGLQHGLHAAGIELRVLFADRMRIVEPISIRDTKIPNAGTVARHSGAFIGYFAYFAAGAVGSGRYQ